MATIGEVGERALVRNIRAIIRRSPGLGPGDDAAVIACGDGNVVASTDSVSFDRHFPDGMTYEQFGWTAAAVNFSDIAAMGARPTGILAALMLPEGLEESAIYDIMSGIDQCAEFCGTWIVGGDTKFGSGAVTGTAIGSLDGRKPLSRGGAVPGDIVAVTGCLGAAAAGYYGKRAGMDVPDSVFALMVPVPRVEEGIMISQSGAATSCMDLSDGFAVAAREICAASGVGMEIHEEFLPIGGDVDAVADALGMDRRDLVLYWGGDYELMFTFRKDMIDRLYEAGLAFSIVGIVTDGDGPYIAGADGRERMRDGRY